MLLTTKVNTLSSYKLGIDEAHFDKTKSFLHYWN